MGGLRRTVAAGMVAPVVPAGGATAVCRLPWRAGAALAGPPSAEGPGW